MQLDVETYTAQVQDEGRLRLVPALWTRRLRLETLREAHAGALFPGLSDAVLYEFLGECAPENVESLAAQFRRNEGGASSGGQPLRFEWALWSLITRSYIGVIQARVHPDRSAHLSIVLFHEAWGQGYAREAVTATIDHIRDAWGVRDVLATVDVRNQRAIDLLTRLRFLRFGVLRRSDMLRCNPSDEYVYLLRLAPSPSGRSDAMA